MKDEAVSPVVAFMLLLMIAVSFISLLNAYYIPSLKQQAEIEHLGQVQRSFQIISSDIDRLLSFRQDGIIKERVDLGGGDVMFSPLRSSGTLQIADDGWISRLTVTNNSGYISVFNCTQVSLSYHPLGNFWINQGYEWGSGLVNVTKGNRAAWADYTSGINANRAQNSFLSVLSTPVSDESPSLSHPDNLADIRITMQNMSYLPNSSFISSNGVAGIDLRFTATREEILNVSAIQFILNPTHPSFDTVRTIYAAWFADSFNHNNCFKTIDMSSGTFTVSVNTIPVNVTIMQNVLSVQVT